MAITEKKKAFSLAAYMIAGILAALLMVPGVALGSGQLSATFSFDSGLPPLSSGQNTPFNQSSGGITALFTSPTDPNTFSVQSYATTFFKLSSFSGNFLYDNLPMRNMLEIRLNQSVSSITLAFATLEYHGGPNDWPTNLTLTAYSNSSAIGSASSRGAWPSGSTYPQGILEYASSQPFDMVRIELTGQGLASDFLVDNVTVGWLDHNATTPGDTGANSAFPALEMGIAALAIAAVVIIVAIFRRR